MTATHVVDVLLDSTLLTINRAVGVLRRRNLAAERFTVRPCGTAGVSRMTFVIHADAATADRVVQQFHKTAGVRAVEITASEHYHHEEQP